MSAVIARMLLHASASGAEIDTFAKVALFSAVGLLLSLTILILDQNIPGEFF